MAERRAGVGRKSPLPVARRYELLDISRSGFYYQRKETPDEEYELMKLIDRHYLEAPFYGARKIAVCLRSEGHVVNRKRVRRLMSLMGIRAIYRRPRTSQPALGHKIYPYLLGDMKINRPNQVWAADITYIPMKRGFLYLVAIIDWYSRCVLSWRLSNTMEADFCIEALKEALKKGKPEVFNTDQGSQFTGDAFTRILKHNDIRISMDGKGSYNDNLFIERLWRSVKYEEVFLKAYQDGKEARNSLARYFRFYNTGRPHQSLGYRTPGEIYATPIEPPTRGMVQSPSSTAGSHLILTPSLSQ